MREKHRLFVVEGPSGIQEALRKQIRLHSVFLDPAEAPDRVVQDVHESKVPTFEVSSEVMSGMSGTVSPQGVIAIAPFVDLPPAELTRRPPALSVVAAGVRDPGNAGTLLRSCWAAGADAVFFGSESVDVYNPKVVRASAGALFNLRLSRDAELPLLLGDLAREGVRLIACDARSATPYWEVDMTGPCAFVLGNEAWGLPQSVLDLCTDSASIPLAQEAESLNVAVAASVVLFESVRQRRVG